MFHPMTDYIDDMPIINLEIKKEIIEVYDNYNLKDDSFKIFDDIDHECCYSDAYKEILNIINYILYTKKYDLLIDIVNLSVWDNKIRVINYFFDIINRYLLHYIIITR